MPALKICGGLTTRPFAGDDLQILCLIFGAYRVIQLACVIPFWVQLYLYRLRGEQLIGPNGYPIWCVGDDFTSVNYNITAENLDEYLQQESEKISHARSMFLPFSLFLILSLVYTVLDLFISLAIWSAAGMGTPTDPRGRDTTLKTLIWLKLVFMNLILIAVLGSGIYLVAEGRRTNYGCGPDGNDVTTTFENSAWYLMFCLVMVTYAFEILLLPGMLTNQITKTILSKIRKYSEDQTTEHKNTEAFLGACFVFLRCLSCNQMGGGKIQSQSDLSDAAVTFMEFFNCEANFDTVLSDVYITLKLMGRELREKKYKMSKQARLDGKNTINVLVERKESACDVVDIITDETGEPDLEGRDGHRDGSDGWGWNSDEEIQRSDKFNHLFKKGILQHTNSSDLYHLRNAARFSHHSLFIYDHIPQLMTAKGILDSSNVVYNPWKTDSQNCSVSSFFRLTEAGFPNTVVAYANLTNDIIATPYCILVEEDTRTVVVAVRGTASLEDLVTDLQMKAASMERIGEVCGTVGKDKYAHRGILASCKWIYNDIIKQNILCRIFDDMNCNGNCELVFTGHSLGATAAAILCFMFRPNYPNLKGFVYCPPGCSVSPNLSHECAEYVTSVVVGNDVIPRVNVTNFEKLRYDFLETLARIRVPKVDVWKDLRNPCKNDHLEIRNRRLLHTKGEIPQSTRYSKQLSSFREERMRVLSENFPIEHRLTLPGRLIHLIKYNGKMKYAPYWESMHSFDDLVVNAEAIGEHSLDNLVEVLDNISNRYENASKGIQLDDEFDPKFSFQVDDSESSMGNFPQHDLSGDRRGFVLCSQPYGLVTLIPTSLATVAAFFSIVGNNICSLFLRDIIPTNATKETYPPVEAVSLGLYSYGLEYYDTELQDVILQCTVEPNQSVPDDIYILLARTFSALALVLGFPVTIFLCFANCTKLSDNSFRVISLIFFFVACCQSLIFLFLKSDRCHQSPLPSPPDVLLRECQLNTGSKMSIVASVLWMMASVFTAFMSEAVTAELQLLSFVMEVKGYYVKWIK